MIKKSLLAILAASFLSSPAYALTLSWNPVTQDADGADLSADQAVTQYNVYRCSGGGACSVAAGTKIGVVAAPAVSIDISSQPVPSNYVVTAVNIIAESAASPSLKVTPPMAPGGSKVK
jgi:phage baseplate assembly protein gpV